ncbi:MAG: holo-ACP synthase [Clostridia bacterium]|nr:holo-ACP synthase [Clostridia bacterium]
MIGVDIIKVSRVSKLAKSDVNNRVFTKAEVEYANKKAITKTIGDACSQRDNTFAGMFNAKEAFLKALGLGLGDAFSLSDIEIDHKKSGEPFIVITDKIGEYLKSKNLSEVNLSISHDGGFSIAVVEIK